jgi:rhodanese-related sulfurtransferase
MKITQKIQQGMAQAGIILLLAFFSGIVFNHFNSSGIRLLPPVQSVQNEVTATDSVGLETTGEPQLISPEQAFRFFETQSAIFIDARKSEHYEFGHIPGARLLTWAGMETPPAIPADLNPDQLLVIYCSDPGCEMAVELAYFLAENGYHRLYLFEGGWEAWSAGNFPTETGVAL